MLVAPLDWGLGHATRCIPIIRALIANGFTVLLAAEGAQAHLLQTEFPDLTILPLEGYRVRYSKKRWALPFVLLLQLPRLLRIIRKENRWLRETIDEHQVDLVISDNRYGLYTEKVSSVFITHQLQIKAPFSWVEALLQKINYHYINRFTACWVPDGEQDKSIAGKLSHPGQLPKTPVHYIGLLSRFSKSDETPLFDYCILLSGPEPQRTLLEERLIKGISGITCSCLLIRGKPGNTLTPSLPSHITVKNHLSGSALEKAILQSRCIISRSGYTTVMEILSLGKKALFIPTPGQTEQEYLAKILAEKGVSLTVVQEELDCSKQLPDLALFTAKPLPLTLFEPGNIAALIQLSIDDSRMGELAD